MKCTRFLALLLAVAFALCVFTACGKKEESSGEPSGGSTSGGSTVHRPKYMLPTKVVQTYYDSQGNTASALLTIRMEEGEFLFTREAMEGSDLPEYTYRIKLTQTGMALSVAKYGPDGALQQKLENAYDDSRNLVKRTVYNADGSVAIEQNIQWEYNDFGNPIKSTERDENGNVTRTTVFEYIAEGWLLSRVEYNGEGAVAYRYVYEYEPDGRATVTACDGDWVVERTVALDETGKTMEEVLYSENWNVAERITYEYDKNGNLTKKYSERYAEDGSVCGQTTEEHTFDERGSWSTYSIYDPDAEVNLSCEVTALSALPVTRPEASYLYQTILLLCDLQKEGNLT